MNDFLGAVAFLTTIPLPLKKRAIGLGTLLWFPFVGILIGTLIFVFDLVFLRFFSVQVASLLSVLSLALITGGIHLDGLADSADGLFSHRTREEALRIMKTSDIGAMGAMALFFVLALKWAAIASIPRAGWANWLDFVLPCAYARAGIVLGTYFLPYARKEGTGKEFVAYRQGAGRLLPIILLMSVPLSAGLPRFLVTNATFITVSAALLFFYYKRIAGITGDMLGALSEVTETVLFLTWSSR